ncbi:SLAP domain-containing protein [Bacillus sinesaloumensis]|uniref:SLAP domain-containing protein n=1 Tax=Litchfieldia sinesaloumensis TaxID=1926280 RepID=UPI0009883CC9|nr:SLAP domain-containing protein [Bacillus sinesaloumensis]
MQKLQFEAAWDRTISEKDRREIQSTFQEVAPSLEPGIHFTTFRIAVNHKNEQLVTSIIHNCTEESFLFKNTPLQIWNGDTLLAEQAFTISSLQVGPETSMPWTFIFPADGFEISESTKDAKLKLKKEK